VPPVAVSALLALLGVLCVAALQREPVVASQASLAVEDVQLALQLLKAHDPRLATPGQVMAVSLSGHEVELLVNHGGQRFASGAGQVTLYQAGALLRLSLHLNRWLPPGLHAGLPWGRWLNIEARVAQTAGLPALQSLTIGRLPIPVVLAKPMLLRTLEFVGLAEELPLLAEVVQHVRFMPDRVQLVYAWQSGIGERMISALLPADDKRRLQVYTEHLAAVLRRQGPLWQVSMADLMGPLFELALQRSAQGHDAARENRAAIVVLALYLNGRSLGPLLPPGADGVLRPTRVLLGGRDDWPLHFMVSAALATESSGPLSYAVGLFKEVADARGGSGFSFNDMAANRAGTRFGELAVSQPAQLQATLRALAARRTTPLLLESDFMPMAADLPEFMTEAEFERRFGGVGAPAYVQQMAEIERRVAALPVLRGGTLHGGS
jgi:hypothetical protein